MDNELCEWANLPFDLLCCILDNIPPKERVKCELVCKSWKEALSDSRWFNWWVKKNAFLLSSFNISSEDDLSKCPARSWKEACIKCQIFLNSQI